MMLICLSFLAAVTDDASGSPNKIRVAGHPDGFLQAQLEQFIAKNDIQSPNNPSDIRLSSDILSNATAAGNDKIAGNS